MEFFNQAAQNAETQLLIPLLLMLVPMLRTIPTLPKWSNQWIILIIGIILSVVMSGFNFTAISNGFFASMAVTYVSVGVTRPKDEKAQMKQKSFIESLHRRLNPAPTTDTSKPINQEVFQTMLTGSNDTELQALTNVLSNEKQKVAEAALQTILTAENYSELQSLNNAIADEKAKSTEAALQTLSDALHHPEQNSAEAALQTLTDALQQTQPNSTEAALQTLTDALQQTQPNSTEAAPQTLSGAITHSEVRSNNNTEKYKPPGSRFKMPQKKSNPSPFLFENEEDFFNQLSRHVQQQILTDCELCPNCRNEIDLAFKKQEAEKAKSEKR